MMNTLIFLPRRHDHPRTEDAEEVLSNAQIEREKREGGIRHRQAWSAGHAQARPRANTTPSFMPNSIASAMPHHGEWRGRRTGRMVLVH